MIICKLVLYGNEGSPHTIKDFKIVNPPLDQFKNKEMIPPKYMIESYAEGYFLLHREMKEDEETLNHYDHFEYENKKWLWCIANVPSENEAMAAIRSYWKAFKQLEEWGV